ncbi:porin [Vibrio sp. NH-UV-68]|uniref:porin n=1 Tax=unclassified Vibrio TaxID=2614977 RepID=UPI0036F249D1
MDKMFKRTLLGAAVALASTSAFANTESSQVGIISDFNVQAYGVAAISAFTEKDQKGYQWDNESRIGFRADKDFSDNVNIFMQIESGWVGTDGTGATLGNRDTYLGLRGDWGTLRAGRMLTPMYELVDWPYSNPGLGRVWDSAWAADVAYHRDRHGNQLRYDSAQLGNFNYSLSTGVGDTGVDNNYFYGAKASVKAGDMITFHAAFETEQNRQKKEAVAAAWEICTDASGCGTGILQGDNYEKAGTAAEMVDTLGYLIGFEASLPGGFGLSAAYKAGSSDVQGGAKSEQGSYSVIGQYWNGPWGFKLGYAANLDYELDGAEQENTADNVVSGQLMYVKNGFVPYFRVGSYTKNDGDSTPFVRLGLEYGF